MKKSALTFIILLFGLYSLNAQDKYMIYFKDKGKLNKSSLQKNADRDILAKRFLSERSIERRKKNLGENYFLHEDLPIEEQYIIQLKSSGIKIHNKLKWFNAVSAYLTDEQISFLKLQNYVDKIEKVRIIKSTQPIHEKSDTPQNLNKSSSVHRYDYGASRTQYELSDIPALHDMGITGEGIIIGLLDSGFDWKKHISLKDRTVIAEYDFIYKDTVTANDEKDADITQHNHGTSVFSILAGFDEGNIVGPAFNSEFILAKTEFIPTERRIEEDNYAAALEWMDSIGVDITTSSLGYSEFDPPDVSYTYADMNGHTTIVTKAAELAFDRGIVVITSAGNEGDLSWHYITAPADGYNTMAIGAVTSGNIIASFSSRGPTFDGRIKPEIVAQGVSVFKANAGSVSGYSYGNGTSYAAPIACGIAGLLLSAHPYLNNKQVRAIMMESGDNVDNPNNDIGYGLISALRAITYPNLEKNGNTFILHKIFNTDLNINENSVELVFTDGSRYSMIKNSIDFKVELPSLTIGQEYQIYFDYKDSLNISHRIPTAKNYHFIAGQLYIDLILTDVVENSKIPEEFYLSQNYPNPFNPVTKIEYSIPDYISKSRVILKVYDILGTEVKTLVNAEQNAGNYTVDFSSQGLSSGVYFYQLRAGNFTQTKKLTILK